VIIAFYRHDFGGIYIPKKTVKAGKGVGSHDYVL